MAGLVPAIHVFGLNASCSLPARQCVHVGSGQGFATDPPVTAFDLFDNAPGDAAHVFAFDRNHRIGEFADDLVLLFLAEHVFNHSNLNEGH
jgi:hypothetical protein